MHNITNGVIDIRKETDDKIKTLKEEIDEEIYRINIDFNKRVSKLLLFGIISLSGILVIDLCILLYLIVN